MPYAIAKMGLPIDASGNAVAVARQPRSCLKLPAGDGTMPLSVASRMVLSACRSQRCYLTPVTLHAVIGLRCPAALSLLVAWL